MSLRLRLLGGFHIERNGRVVLDRLPSRAATLLLARLALFERRQHPREELIELLWPGVSLEVGRNRLRQALSTLRALLEVPSEPLIQADRSLITLLPGAIGTDVAEFEAALARSDAAAALQYRGELLPGHFDDWVVTERHRLAALADGLPQPSALAAAAVPAIALRAAAAAELPRYLTRYFAPAGRLEALAATLPSQRLTTLVGPGGVGKTRLAVELAWQQAGSGWRCGLAALAEVQDAAGLAIVLEQALTPSPGGGWPAVEAAARELDLLVLDNAEQALAPVAEAARRLLAAAPGLHLLVTSRHALELDGERLLEVAPLAPGEDTAQALFIDRARAVRADFHASRDNQAALAALIQALDGLPLALELAAARVRSFSPAQMLAQWQQVGSQGLPTWLASPHRAPRHASLDGLLGWSLQLLTPDARRLLARLAALPGPFALDDALAQGGSAAALDELVSHSLLQVAADTEPRYCLLEPLRQAALAGGAPADAAASRCTARQALAQWAGQLGAAAPLAAWAGRRAGARALLSSSEADGDAPTGLALALAMRPCWESDGADSGLVTTLAALLAQAPSSAGHELLAQIAFTHGQRALALVQAERALALAGSHPALRASALVRRAWLLLAGDGQEQGQTGFLDEAIALARRAGDAATEARAWQQLAAIAVSRSQPAQAEALYTRAQELWEQLGHSRQAQARLRNRAQCLIELGELPTAVAWIAASQRRAQAEGDGVGQFDAAFSLAQAHEAARDWPATLASLQQALRVAHSRQHLHARALALLAFGRPLARLRQPERALQVAAFAQAHWQQHLGALAGREARALARMRRLAGAQVPAAVATGAWARGQSLSLNEALALALA